MMAIPRMSVKSADNPTPPYNHYIKAVTRLCVEIERSHIDRFQGHLLRVSDHVISTDNPTDHRLKFGQPNLILDDNRYTASKSVWRYKEGSHIRFGGSSPRGQRSCDLY